MAKSAPGLTGPQLAQLSRAALNNAAALLEDARILLICERWPRAYGMAILAAEEFGKFYLCATTGTLLGTAHQPSWRSFWDKFWSHRKKFAMWYGAYVDQQVWGPVGSPGDEKWLSAWNSRKHEAHLHDVGKQSGLYVGFEDNAVQVPTDVVDEVKAAELFIMVQSVIGPWMTIASQDLTSMLSPDPRVAGMLDEVQYLAAACQDKSAKIDEVTAILERYLGEAFEPSNSESEEPRDQS